MGEKEIKPAAGAGGGVKVATDPNASPAIQSGGGHTTGHPDTGPVTNLPPNPPNPPKQGPKDSGPSKPWSGSDRYEDGYRMTREESGDFSLDHPDGGKATWDAGSESWKGADGKAMSDDWAGGHRPTKYETGRS